MSNPYGQQPSDQQPYGQPGGYGQQPYGQQPGYGSDPNNLDQPLFGATLGQAARRFFKKYATFTGRASRSEFWWWYLISFAVSMVLLTLWAVTLSGSFNPNDPTSLFTPFYWIAVLWGLATFVGFLALSTRRLHDTNRSGWWYLISLVPFVGAIVLIVFWASEGNPAGARYDLNPGGYAGGPYPG